METYQNKLKKLIRFTDQTLQCITENPTEYKQFLSFQARLYKYKFEESVLIYAQNPNAIACATYNQWNNKRIGRRIRAGSKGIALFANDSQKKLKYVFDLSQTYGKTFIFPALFTIPEKYQAAVLDSFETQASCDTFSKNFKLCIEEYVHNNYDKFIEDFIKTAKVNDSAITNEMFRKTIAESVAYIACEKFSIPKGIYDSESAFESLPLFNSKEIAILLGSATQNIAKNAILHINAVIINEQKKEQEQHLLAENSTPEPPQSEVVAEKEHVIEAVQTINPPIVPQSTAYDGSIPIAEAITSAENEHSQEEKATSPEPIFIDNKLSTLNGIDFSQYQDSDIVAYRKDGKIIIADSNNYYKYSVKESFNDNHGVNEDLEVPQHFLEQMSPYIYNKAKSDNPATKPFMEIDSNSFETKEHYYDALCKKVDDYVEPVVIVPFSESTEFVHYETLTFAEADAKIRTVEKEWRLERNRLEFGGYHKTDLIILYKSNPDAEELDAYISRYDIGDYSEEDSGIINHISNFWQNIKSDRNTHSYVNQEDIDSTDNMLEILKAYTESKQQESSILPPPAPDIIPIQSKSPEPVFSGESRHWRLSADMSKDKNRDNLGYDKNGANHTTEKSGDIIYFTSDTYTATNGAIYDADNIPPDILVQMKTLQALAIQSEPFFMPQSDISNPQDSLDDFILEQEDNQWTEPTEQAGSTDIKTESEAVGEKPPNFVITSADDITLAGGKTKYHYNLESIKMLKTIESENRYATPDEQRTLAKFSGFGGIPQAFDPQNENWIFEYEELKSLLTENEYERALHSTLNAHYSSTEVIEAMYKGLERLGFSGGNLAEPACGDGRFFGMLPEHFQENTRLYGIELDSLTGRIASQLYPNANIEIKGYQDTNFQDNFFDAAIGNVPFGNYSVADRRYNCHNFFIHDYFFAKTLDKVKPGGIIAFITSSGTMDKANTKARQYIAERAELLGAIRLPNTAFQQSDNTQVTTDIIFLKKRDRIIDATNEEWIYTGYHNTGRMAEDGEYETLPLNQYYIDNPHMMLGEMHYDKSMYGNDKLTALHPFEKPQEYDSTEEKFQHRFEQLKAKNDYTDNQLEILGRIETIAKQNSALSLLILHEHPIFKQQIGSISRVDDIFDGKLAEIIDYVNADEVDKSQITLEEQLKTAISFLPENVVSNIVSLDDLEDLQESRTTIPADPYVKNFCYALIDNMIYQREDSEMVLIDLEPSKFGRMKALIELRETVKNLIDIQLENCSDEELQQAQTKLNNQYDKFRVKYSYINSKFNRNFFGEDSEFPLLSSIESINEDESITKADIFTKRTIKPHTKIEKVDTAIEALAVCLNDNGHVNIPYMASLCSKENEQVIEDLQSIIFKDPLADNLSQSYDPNKNWLTADEYLSGNVVEKLEVAKLFSEDNSIYTQNIGALEIVQPTPLEAPEIEVSIGAQWIDTKYYQQFMQEIFKESKEPQIIYSQSTNNWKIADKNKKSIEATQKYGTNRMNGFTLMELMLNQRQPRIYDTVKYDNTEKRVFNKVETIAIKKRYSMLQQDFKQWLWKDPERREELTAKYNKLFNSERVRQYDGSFLRFEGMNPTIKLDKHQSDAVARILFGGNTLLAHVVGAGKTYTMATAGMEMKRLGLANKPCYVVPNHMVEQFANDFKKLYPNANVLAATKNDFVSYNRKRFCSRIATGDWDAVIIGHSSFELIPISEERKSEKIKKDIEAISSGLYEAKKNKGERSVIKQLERTKATLQAKLKRMTDSPKDNVIIFENLGIDALFVDEADLYKNKYIYTKMGNLAGLQTQGNNKTYDLAAKVEFINEYHGSERNVVFATGTPVSNSLVELYTMQTYLQMKALVQRGLDYFDNWAASFAEVSDVLEIDKTGYRLYSSPENG